jgi:hypothetical protein
VEKKFRRGFFGVAQSPKQSSGGTDLYDSRSKAHCKRTFKKNQKNSPSVRPWVDFEVGPLLCLGLAAKDGRRILNYPNFANDSDCQQAGVPRMIVPTARPRLALVSGSDWHLGQLDWLCRWQGL